MFKIVPDPTFTSPVKIPVHGGEDQEVVFIFKHKDEEQLDEFYKKLELLSKKKPRTIKGVVARDAEILMEFTAGWQDVDAEFSKDSLATFLSNYKAAGKRILDAWEKEIHQAPIKN